MVVVHTCGGTESASALGGKRPAAYIVHGTLALPSGCPQARVAHKSVYIELVYTQKDVYTYGLHAHARKQCSERATQNEGRVSSSTLASQKTVKTA